LNYYLKHRRLFQGIAAWAFIFSACTGRTEYWWIVFFAISMIIGQIERFIDKQKMRTAKTNNHTYNYRRNDDTADKLV
jgi:hypothetical protein